MGRQIREPNPGAPTARRAAPTSRIPPSDHPTHTTVGRALNSTIATLATQCTQRTHIASHASHNSANPDPVDTHLTRHVLNAPSSLPAIKPGRSSRDSHVPRSPCDITGRLWDNRIRVPRPARASEANPAYPELPATSQALDPNLAVTSQARIHPKATAASPDSAATSQACNSPLAPRRQLFYEPVEPLQVIHEGINASTSGGMKWGFAIGYIDDIMVYSDTWVDQLAHLRRIFEALRKANLEPHPGRCAFGAQKAKYLGHLVTRDGIRACPSKIKAIVEMLRPASAKEVQRFVRGLPQN